MEAVEGQVNPGLLQRALDALKQHRASIAQRDFIGVADFSLPSRAPRFHLVRLADGTASQGCFAVAGPSLDEIMTRLGPGRLIYAGKA
jgi:hypothetical protein